MRKMGFWGKEIISVVLSLAVIAGSGHIPSYAADNTENEVAEDESVTAPQEEALQEEKQEKEVQAEETPEEEALPEEAQKERTSLLPVSMAKYVAAPVYHDPEDMCVGGLEKLPERYFPEDILPEVKDQGSSDNCWAYAATSALEANLAKKYGISLKGEDAFDPDFFPDILYSRRMDPLGLTRGDEINRFTKYTGGDSYPLAFYLMNGLGPVSYRTTGERDLSQLGYGDSEYTMRGAYTIPATDHIEIKRAIMKYGAVTAGIDGDQFVPYSVSENGILELEINPYLFIPGDEEFHPNHEITIVGWDDNIPAEYFNNEYGECGRNGGWIIQNSWGAEYWVSAEDADKEREYYGLEKTGEPIARELPEYYYLSYQNNSMWSEDDYAVVYDAEQKKGSENIYHYDGTINMLNVLEAETAANRFRAQANPGGSEFVTSVIAGVSDPGRYKAQIYLCPEADKKPWEQQLLSSVDFTANYTGFYRVELDRSVMLAEGEDFAVAIRRQDGKPFSIYIDETENIDWLSCENYTEEGESYIDDYDYYDIKGVTPRIKAVTVNTDAKLDKSFRTAAAKVKPIANKVYAGSPVTLSGNELQVYKGDNLLIQGVDYDVTYSKNTGVGTASVKITPRYGNKKTVTARFKIIKAPGNPLVGEDKYCILTKETIDLNTYYEGAEFSSEDKKIVKQEGGSIFRGKRSGFAEINARFPDGTEKEIRLVVEKPKAVRVKAESDKEIDVSSFYSCNGYARPLSVTSSKTAVAEVTLEGKIKPVGNGSSRLELVFGDKCKVKTRIKVKLK